MFFALLSLLVATPSAHAEDTTITRLPMKDLRTLARSLKDRDRSFIQEEASMRVEAVRLRIESDQVASEYKRDCASTADRLEDAALEVRCQHLSEQHLQLRVDDLRLQARAWEAEAEHLGKTQKDVERLAVGALPDWDTPSDRAVAADKRTDIVGGAAGVVLLGDAKASRLAGGYLRDIQGIPAKIDAKIQKAAKAAGVKEPNHLAVALAARAAKGKVLHRELTRGAQELQRIADMLELGGTLDPDGVQLVDLGEFITPLGDEDEATGFGIAEDPLPVAPAVSAMDRRF